MLDERPTTERTIAPIVAHLDRGGGATRFALRLARRETRRRPGRTVLAALLIAVPVAAMTVGSVLVRTNAHGDRWDVRFATQYGTADVVVDPWTSAVAEDGVDAVSPPPGTRALDALWVQSYLAPGDDAPTRYATLTDLDLDDPMVADVVEVLDGRRPTSGEVLLAPELADEWDVSIGDELTLERPSGTWTVAGIGRYRADHWTELVVIPGFDRERVHADRGRTLELWDLPDTATDAEVRAFANGVGGFGRLDDPYVGSNSPTAALAWGWVAGALALVAVGIIVAAAFATSARRQLVTVGQLLSNGATERVVRRTLALQGTWTALAGAALGLAVGVLVAPTATGIWQRIVRHDVGGPRIFAGDLAIILATAIVVGTVAAAVPARSAARIPVLSALAGHRPVESPSRRLVPIGLSLVGGGLGVLVVAATGARDDRTGSALWPLLVVVGSVAVVFGMVCATPLVVERLGRLGRRAPLSLRLGMRSLDRTRARSTAVIAAIAVAVGGSVAAAALVEQGLEDDAAALPQVPADAVIVFNWEEVACCDGTVDADPLPPLPVPADAVDRLDSLLPGATTSPLLVATYDPPPIDWASYDGPYPDRQGPIVATPEMLDLLGLDAADEARVASGEALLVRPAGSSAFEPSEPISYVYPTETGDIVITPTVSDRPVTYGEAYDRPIVSPALAEQLGFELVERGAIVRAGASLTAEQRDGVGDLFGIGSVLESPFVEAGDPIAPATSAGAVEPYWTYRLDDPSWRTGNDVWLARLVISAAALLVTALVVAIGLSLAAAEGRDERDVLLAVGARPASMRRQAAAKATVLTVAGVALGIPTGFVPAWVVVRTVGGGGAGAESLGVPWTVISTIAVVVPLAVAAIAWLGSGIAQRARPPRVSRRD